MWFLGNITSMGFTQGPQFSFCKIACFRKREDEEYRSKAERYTYIVCVCVCVCVVMGVLIREHKTKKKPNVSHGAIMGGDHVPGLRV